MSRLTERRSMVPWAMVILRVLLCPLIVLGARRGWSNGWLGVIVLIGLVDDIYDGKLARRWQSDTVALRRADSWADTIFYLGVAAALWVSENQLMRGHGRLLLAIALLELFRHGFDWCKFGRAASYHSYLAKFWGLSLAVAIAAVLCFGGPRWLFPFSLWIGIVADAEGLLMSLVLPRWQNDLKGLREAWSLRRTMLKAAEATAPR